MRPGRIVVMAGPSLPPPARTDLPSFAWLPPATAGDVAALLNEPPAALCLIDGYFDSAPAPWHKELLLLIAAGTQVFGASSMGALRAAELDRHGMIGVGAIYAAYRDGRVTGDDEVALIHAPERLGWAPLSVPLVEIRATLVAACHRGLIEVEQARRIRAAAACIHFSDRDWPLLGSVLTTGGLCDAATAAQLERLHVPLKRLDALACLNAAICANAGDSRPAAPPITYFVAELLKRVRRQARQSP